MTEQLRDRLKEHLGQQQGVLAYQQFRELLATDKFLTEDELLISVRTLRFLLLLTEDEWRIMFLNYRLQSSAASKLTYDELKKLRSHIAPSFT